MTEHLKALGDLNTLHHNSQASNISSWLHNTRLNETRLETLAMCHFFPLDTALSRL